MCKNVYEYKKKPTFADSPDHCALTRSVLCSLFFFCLAAKPVLELPIKCTPSLRFKTTPSLGLLWHKKMPD